MPERRALLLMAVDAALHRVDVHERQHVRAGQQRRLPGQLREQVPARRLQLADITPGERAQERPQRGRGPHPAEQLRHRAVPQQAHVVDRVGAAAMPATRQPTFTSGYTPVLAAIVTWRRTRDSSPARSASAITGTSPPRDTRFGSLKDAEILSGSCDNRI